MTPQILNVQRIHPINLQPEIKLISNSYQFPPSIYSELIFWGNTSTFSIDISRLWKRQIIFKNHLGMDMLVSRRGSFLLNSPRNFDPDSPHRSPWPALGFTRRHENMTFSLGEVGEDVGNTLHFKRMSLMT